MNYQAPKNGFRTFLIVWATQSVSVFGTALTFFAVTIWLTQVLYPRPDQKPELALAISALSIFSMLPTVFLAPLAGAWADRHDRKRTMMAMDFASGLLSILLAFLLLTNGVQLWMLLGLVVLYTGFGAFHSAAFDSSYAMLVPEAQLPRANGMMQTVWSLSAIVSPAVAALLISLPALGRQGLIPGSIGASLAGMKDGTSLAIGVDAVTFLLAAAALIFLFIPSPVRADLRTAAGKVQKSIWADVKEGALFIWRRRPILWLLGTFTVANFLPSPMGVFEPLIVKFNLVPDWTARGFSYETALALLGSVGGIGGLAGGFFISTWGGLKRRRVYGVIVPMIVAAVGLVGFGFSGWLYVTAAMAFVMSAMTPLMNAHSQAIWQRQTPVEMQGRVFAVRRRIAWFTIPFGSAFAGIAAGVFNPGWIMGVLGVLFLLFCIGQLFNPYLLRVEDKEWLDSLAAQQVPAE